ncbi:DUF4158 domain-containing protein [Streptomyces sp. NPDC021356]|uniref:DUF4158 domain-containing protein n=1 Tax=Streptomyces sp. NPDC021356 TaxID=3154900 RepID=UPI0033D0A4AC
MGRDLGLDGVVDHFTLSSDEAGWLRNKTGATRLGFAVQLKCLTWRGRFPRMRLELPPDAVEHVAKQVGVAASELAFYDFTSRAAKRHRSELRDLTGWRECTRTDLDIGSVCTGSLLLAAAGLLEGRRANTHWRYRPLLAKFGVIPVAERWVEDGNVITSAGVSAGIDMALYLVARLAGKDVARVVQLFIEYDPEPPFGPIDWTTANPAQYDGLRTESLCQALADHPELLQRLLG